MEALGIIAGSGRLPFVGAEEARAQGRRVIAVAIQEETDPGLAHAVDAIHWVRVGQLGALVRALREEQVTDAILLGKVEITRLFSRARPDLLAAKVLLKARDLRGDSLLEAIVDALASEGIRILETPPFLGPLLVQAGRLTGREPTAREQRDIGLGREIARQIAALRIGQTVVLKHGTVLAVESVEGSDAAIRRGGELGRGGVVVVKVSRPDQDLRFDLPTVGVQTLSALRDASATALALDAGRTLMLDRDQFVAGADTLGLAVVAD
ncbi:MAG: UDP-2,3-diacylglucosamine diphosphatase LpxI [candidate division NC10 bacterium]|nr:UDP-2,3-diacylglucosamine diphosphatase LpxI [candidate division NC10 bacterium]